MATLFGTAVRGSPRHDAQMAGSLRVGQMARLPYPLRQVLRRWRGMVGMVLGVGIALGMGMTLLGSSKATMDVFTADFIRSGTDLYVVQEGGVIIPLLPGDSTGTIKHARHVLGQIRGMPQVSSALAVMSGTLEREGEWPRRRGELTELISAMGVDGDPSRIPDVLELREGRWVAHADEVVLGPKLAREKAFRLGDPLRLNGRDFLVVGIGELRGFGFGTDSIAYLDYAEFRQRAHLGDVFNIIAIDTRETELVRRRVRQIDPLSVLSPGDLVVQAEDAMAADNVAHWTLITLTMAIAGLFVSNMLSRAVAQRRLEFATLRAIGIPSRTILLAVGSEAAAISLAASVVGMAIASFLGFLLNAYLAPQYGFETFYAADAPLIALVVGLSLGLGLVAGLLPAREATRVDPVEVLREA